VKHGINGIVIFTVPPSKPSVSVSPQFPWFEKTQGSLQCNVADKGNPPITNYTWLDGATTVSDKSDSTLTFESLSNIDHGKRISCRVNNYVKTAMISTVVTLNVECK